VKKYGVQNYFKISIGINYSEVSRANFMLKKEQVLDGLRSDKYVIEAMEKQNITFEQYVQNQLKRRNLTLDKFIELKQRYLQSGREFIELVYPMIEAKITRSQEPEIIKSFGYEIPVKSGCYFCPYTTVKGWTKLRSEHPELYQKSKDMQNNSKMKKKFIRFNENETLDNMLGCSCFNGKFDSPDDTMIKSNSW